MLKELKTQHRRILRLTAQGMRPSEVASQVGMAVQSVYAILRDPMAKSFLAGLQDKADEGFVDITKQLALLQGKAVNVVDDILTREDVADKTRLTAAKDILDRNGHKAPEKHLHAVGHFTADDIAQLHERADTVDRSYLDVIDIPGSGSEPVESLSSLESLSPVENHAH